jgi:hypothetical protein
MGKINKMLVGTAALFIAALLLVSMVQAAPPVFIGVVNVHDGDNGLYGKVSVKNQCSENITAQLTIKVDSISVHNESVQMDVKQVGSFYISHAVRTEFNVSNDVGDHIIVVTVLVDGNVQSREHSYTIYEPEDAVEEEEEEEVNEEDWLPCP